MGQLNTGSAIGESVTDSYDISPIISNGGASFTWFLIIILKNN